MTKNKQDDNADDAALFHEAIAGTRPLKKTNKIVPDAPRQNIRVARKPAEAENVDYVLSEFAGEVNQSYAEEVLAYRGNGVQQRLFKKLKNGQLPIESRLDMHGMTVDTARQFLSQFIHDCLSARYRCVIIVHGKGSRGGQPVLKSMLNHWLKQIPDILAFSSALSRDGGTGALYVLLKKPQIE